MTITASEVLLAAYLPAKYTRDKPNITANAHAPSRNRMASKSMLPHPAFLACRYRRMVNANKNVSNKIDVIL